MKRVLLLAVALMMLCGVKAQKPVYVYGVDFAQTKVFGAIETPREFETAFIGINNLLYAEPKKYNFSDVFDTSNYEICSDVMIERLQKANISSLRVRSAAIPIFDVPQLLASYELPHSEGLGFVLIARLLDKQRGEGFYYAVLFDIATRKMVLQTEISAPCGGFGLRNHWASTVYRITQKLRIELPQTNY